MSICSFQDPPARAVKAAAPEPLHILRTFSGVLCAALSPDGQRIAIGSKAGVLELWDTERAVVTRKFEGHTGDVHDVFFTPDGKRLVSAAGLYQSGGDQTVRFWDVGTGKEVRKLAGFGSIVSSAALSPDGASLALGHVGGTVGVRALATGEERWRRERLGSAHTPVCVQFSATGRLVAVSGGHDRPVSLLDAVDGKPRAPLPFNNPHRARPAFSPVQPLLAVPPPLRGVGAVLWDTDWGESVLTLPEPPEAAGTHSTAFSPDGKVLAGGGDNGRVVLWEAASGRPICSFGAQRSQVLAVQFSADGKRLISVSLQGVALWDLDDPAVWGDEEPKAAADRLWDRLAGPDAASAYRAMRALVRDPAAALPLLRARLKPASADLDDLLRKLVRDLDSKQFRERERAYLELERRIKDAEPFLRYRLTLPASEEVRRRTRALLAKTNPSKGAPRQPGELVGETLRAVRAVQVLARIGSAEARKVLTALASGAPGAPETRDAQAALKHLAEASR